MGSRRRPGRLPGNPHWCAVQLLCGSPRNILHPMAPLIGKKMLQAASVTAALDRELSAPCPADRNLSSKGDTWRMESEAMAPVSLHSARAQTVYVPKKHRNERHRIHSDQKHTGGPIRAYSEHTCL